MENTSTQFEITIIEKEDLLLLSASGDYSLQKANNLFKLAVDNAVLRNKNVILIDVTTIIGSIPLFDRFQFAEFLSDYKRAHAVDKIDRIAVVGQEPIVDKEKFGETVAVNRGTNVRVFTDMGIASVWLNSK